MTLKPWVVAWYREQDWPAWCGDYHFSGTYQDWLKRAEAGAKQSEAQGYAVAKVVIEPDKFLEWSRSSGSRLDGEARTAYAIWLFHDRESPTP